MKRAQLAAFFGFAITFLAIATMFVLLDTKSDDLDTSSFDGMLTRYFIMYCEMYGKSYSDKSQFDSHKKNFGDNLKEIC